MQHRGETERVMFKSETDLSRTTAYSACSCSNTATSPHTNEHRQNNAVSVSFLSAHALQARTPLCSGVRLNLAFLSHPLRDAIRVQGYRGTDVCLSTYSVRTPTAICRADLCRVTLRYTPLTRTCSARLAHILTPIPIVS